MTDTAKRTRSTWRVDVPEGKSGRVEVVKFTVGEDDFGNLRAKLEGRGTEEGEYTMLRRNGALWMSDTDAETMDHWEAARHIRRYGGRILVNGLGLGMIVKQALLSDKVTHVDVVEIDSDVIALVGPTYTADPRVTIHQADAYEIQWPVGTRWDVAWHDIWGDVSADDLADMTRMKRKYASRIEHWQGCWAQDRLIARRRRERNSPWGW